MHCTTGLLIAALVVTAGAGVTHAQSTAPLPPQTQPQTRSFNPISLAGKWTSSATRNDGVVVRVAVTITQTMKFKGVAVANGRPIWEYEGTLEVEGDVLRWRYTRSSIAMPQAARVDVDKIMAVSADELTLLSEREGRQRVFKRAQ